MECFDNAIGLDEEHTNSPRITSSKLEIGDEFSKILQDNAFNGMDGGDVTDHIAKVIEITEWIKIPNVEINKLRIHVFSKSLSGDAQTWWNNEINETILASKFDNYWEIDRNTKNRLWEFYVNERTNGWIGDLNESYDKTCSDAFFKPYLDAQEANDIYEVIDREYSPIPIPAQFNINNLEELCKIEEFTVIRHSIRNNEEFVTVGPSKVSTIERTPGSMSCIYHELFNKKNEGWTVYRTK
ncbi:hypothetical protein Tco_0539705 [Tanacetum coccineum]